jgi:hypothetical protein
MKKIILATIMAAVIPMMVVAQGQVNFGTTTANHRVVDESLTPVGAGFMAALYGGVDGSLEGALVQLGAAHQVSAGTGFILAGGTRLVPGVAEGNPASLQVRAWDGGFATYELAFADGTGSLGKTAVFSNPTGGPATSPPSTPAFLSGWTSQLVVTAVPEPSTFALAGLGLAGLLIFRRRNK